MAPCMTRVWLVRGTCVARTFLIRRYSCNSWYYYYWELRKPTVCYGHMMLTGCLRAPYEPKFCKTVRDPTSPHDFSHRLLDPYRHRRARGQKLCTWTRAFYGILPGHHTETRFLKSYHLLLYVNSYAMFCAAKQNPVCATFIFIEEIVMEV